MEKWFVPPNMIKFANQEVVNFGYDNTNNVKYKFNSLGFRGEEYQESHDSVILIGNSIGFGIGLAEEETFGFKVAQELGYKYINCAFGCYFHENNDHLENLKILSCRTTNDLFLVQFNNIDRHRINDVVVSTDNAEQGLSKFLDYFNQVEKLLANKQKIYLYWDDVNYELPNYVKDKILIHNKFYLDNGIAGNSSTMGLKSHVVIAKTILAKLAQFS